MRSKTHSSAMIISRRYGVGEFEFEANLVSPLGSRPCNNSVSVYDGQTYKSRLIGKFCGSSVPPLVRSSSNYLLVKFHSDEGTPYKGFSARWDTTAVPTPTPTVGKKHFMNDSQDRLGRRMFSLPLGLPPSFRDRGLMLVLDLKHANKSGCLIQGAVVLSSNQMELWLALGIHAFTLQIQTASG